MSSCILCLVSPVIRSMVCGNFRESFLKEISLDDIDAELLLKLLRLACGMEGLVAEDAEELLKLGELAERFQMEAVRAEVEDKLLKELKVENCLEIIQRSEASGLEQLRKNCYKMIWDSFPVVSQMEGFVKLSKDTMGDLLEADELWVDREEDLLEALLRWMTDNVEDIRAEELLRKIRFGVMSKEYLMSLTSPISRPGHEMLKDLVGEALAKKEGQRSERMWDGVDRLCNKWKDARMKGRFIGADVLQNPEFVAVDEQGRIAVSDSVSHQIIVFNRDGSLLGRTGSRGAAAGQFVVPRGIAVDLQGRIIVADYGNHRIQVLNKDGTPVRYFGSRGSDVGELNGPRGVAIDMEGHIVVADSWNHRIQVFNADGFVVRHFGSRGAVVGQLNQPSGVAVDKAGRIVVADWGNHRVQVFNGDGSVALFFGSQGDGPGQLRHPCGVAMDSRGRFVVVDYANNRVQVFNSDGGVARVIGSAGDGVGQLRNPLCVAIDAAGRILVAEGRLMVSDTSNNHRVQRLRMD